MEGVEFGGNLFGSPGKREEEESLFFFPSLAEEIGHEALWGHLAAAAVFCRA